MVTLTDARQQFIGHLKGRGRSSATILAYSKDIEQLVDLLASKNITNPQEVALEDLRAFMNKLAKENYTTKSISRKTNSVRTFFRFLQFSNLTPDNPSTQLEHPHLESKPPRILAKLEYRALRDAARADARSLAIIELLLQTGIRISELSKITLDDLHLEGPEPTLYIHPAEGSVERTIPFTPSVIEAVKNYLEVRGRIPKATGKTLFITKTGRQLLIRNIRSVIDRYFRLAGVENTKVNDLRHTWVATQLSAGVPLVVVAKLAGHKRLTTTEKYLQYLPSRAAVEKVKLEEL